MGGGYEGLNVISSSGSKSLCTPKVIRAMMTEEIPNQQTANRSGRAQSEPGDPVRRYWKWLLHSGPRGWVAKQQRQQPPTPSSNKPDLGGNPHAEKDPR